MKNKNYSPYGTYSPVKIDAPKSKKQSDPKAEKITGRGDLRGGRKR